MSTPIWCCSPFAVTIAIYWRVVTKYLTCALRRPSLCCTCNRACACIHELRVCLDFAKSNTRSLFLLTISWVAFLANFREKLPHLTCQLSSAAKKLVVSRSHCTSSNPPPQHLPPRRRPWHPVHQGPSHPFPTRQVLLHASHLPPTALKLPGGASVLPAGMKSVCSTTSNRRPTSPPPSASR